MILRIISDVSCVLAVCISLVLIFAFVNPYKRGFYCNDESIRYPFKGSTVPGYAVLVAGVLLPAIALAFMEGFIKNGATQAMTSVQLGRCKIPKFLANPYKVIGVFFFGVTCTHLIVTCCQYGTGSLRPFFMEVCKPNVNCTSPENQLRFINEYNCTGQYKDKIIWARLSFPSGHSSISAYSMTFLVIYLQVKMKRFGDLLIVKFIQLICICIALFIGFSRIMDYKHHLIDVIVGLIVGVLGALATTMYVLNYRIIGDEKRKSILPTNH